MRLLLAGLTSATFLSGYPVVAHVAGVPVEAPTSKAAWGVCPAGTRPVSETELSLARRAVLLALPEIAKQTDPPLDLTQARISRAVHTRRNGFILPSRRRCWGKIFARSVLVMVFLPGERAAPSLRGNPWFYVARTAKAWVIWDEPH